ncbi:F-box protein [Glarea lozoyensis ATCC 20868]|uniref:F-box protein n=1 Tax=Glarea lozoyensis (strain ATCC 20868 / MF5171) TaxID=1116229 RepID=S3CST9_GLAL2|nr:F-box protein [Glarea lozoyensis ATCC 20868]EPE29502.1 F-box protein [Glarea lozoyensis ATCC 20868]
MDTFTSLPLELISSALLHLPIADLLALLRVSKFMNWVAEKLLYKNIKLIWRHKRREQGTREVKQSSFLKLHAVLFNILQIPQRGSYVEHLHVDVGDLINVWGPPGQTKITEVETDLCRSAIAKTPLCSSQREQLFLNLVAGVPSAYISLLLFQTRNIKSLDIGYPGERASKLYGFCQRVEPRSLFSEMNSKATEQSCLCTSDFLLLERFRYSTLWDYPLSQTKPAKIEINNFLPIFNAPRIKSMFLYLFTTQEVFTTVPRIATTITELVLHKYLLGDDQLEMILHATPNLNVLELDYWVKCDKRHRGKSFIDVPHLFNILSVVGCSLKRLKLSSRFFYQDGVYLGIIEEGGDYDDITTSWGLKGSAPSLEDFIRLQVLELPIAVLLGWKRSPAVDIGQLLPLNLQDLVLRDDLWNWERYTWDYEHGARTLVYFINQSTQIKNNLRRITLTISSKRPGITDEEEELLVELLSPYLEGGSSLKFDHVIYEDEFTPGICCNPIDTYSDSD